MDLEHDQPSQAPCAPLRTVLKLDLSAVAGEDHKVSDIHVTDLPAEVWEQGFAFKNLCLVPGWCDSMIER